MGLLSYDRLHSVERSLTEAWTYLAIFVLTTMQLVLVHDLALRTDAAVSEVQPAYYLIPLGLCAIGALKIVKLYVKPPEEA